LKLSSVLHYANPFSHTWRKHRQVDQAPRARPTGRFVLARIVINEWQRIDAQALASQVAYSLVFAIPSLILFVLSIGAVIDKRTGVPVASWLKDQIDVYAPREIQDLLDSIVSHSVTQVGSGTASVSAAIAVIVAIWGASGGINALMNACNRAYGVPDTRSFIAKRVLALILTGVFTVFVLFTGAIFIAGGRLEHWVFGRLALGSTFLSWWALMRWPAILILISIALFLLYTIGPIAHPPFRWAYAGALVAAAAWMLLLLGFRWILNWISPGTPYGATGSVIVFLLFLRMTGIIFILGAALIGLLVRRFRPAA
jgi:membrane protein